MPSTRLPHTRATPTLTGGHDAAETPCTGRPEPYDVLIDITGGAAFRAALAEARAICATCPIATACLRRNAEEPWAQAVITGMSLQQRVKAGTHTRQPHVTAHDQRLADLAAFIDAGHDAATAAARLGISRDSLWRWCSKNGHRDVWARLTRGAAA